MCYNSFIHNQTYDIKMIKFPSIESFRHTITAVQRTCAHHGIAIPTVRYVGVPKLHGTNASIRWFADGSVKFYSRERELSVDSDNAGFCRELSASGSQPYLERLKNAAIRHLTNFRGDVIIFGEWCGKGVQKNVALNLVDKHFVPFWVAVPNRDDTDAQFIRFNPNDGLGIPESTYVYVDIDFNKPDIALPVLLETMQSFEDRCPYAYAVYGVSGIGEGAVFSPVNWSDLPQCLQNEPFKRVFKVKGEKHGNKSVETKAPIRLSDDAAETIDSLVREVLPEWRLEQGWKHLEDTVGEVTNKATGEFIRWVMKDVHKECLDILNSTAKSLNVDPKKIDGAIINQAKLWFMEKVR